MNLKLANKGYEIEETEKHRLDNLIYRNDQFAKHGRRFFLRSIIIFSAMIISVNAALYISNKFPITLIYVITAVMVSIILYPLKISFSNFYSQVPFEIYSDGIINPVRSFNHFLTDTVDYIPLESINNVREEICKELPCLNAIVIEYNNHSKERTMFNYMIGDGADVELGNYLEKNFPELWAQREVIRH